MNILELYIVQLTLARANNMYIYRKYDISSIGKLHSASSLLLTKL